MKSGTKLLHINFRHSQVVLTNKDRHKHTEEETNTTPVIAVPQKYAFFAMKFNLHDSQPDG